MIGQNFHFAFLVSARNTPRMALAAIKTALRVETISGGSIGIFAKDTSRLTRSELQKLVVGDIAEDQEAHRRPRGALSKSVARAYLVNPDIGKVLGGGAPGQG